LIPIKHSNIFWFFVEGRFRELKLSDLFEELLAISLVDIEECKRDIRKRKYVEELILDFYCKIGNRSDKGVTHDAWYIKEIEKIKFNVAKDESLNVNQKMMLYNNFSENKIKSVSRFRRLMIQRKNDNWW